LLTIGDQIQATYSEALAVPVTPAAPPPSTPKK